MPGFRSLSTMAEKYELGQSFYSFWRKTPSQATTAGVWFDFSLSPGNPSPQYYAASPLTALNLARSSDGGINHGGSVSSAYKFLKQFLIMSNSATALPMPFLLCDYLLFYPFIDTSTNDEQFLTNVLPLSRYTDGRGVQVMAVSVAANSGTSPTFVINYTNDLGVSGRISQPSTLNTATANGSIITSSVGSFVSSTPFMSLQSGDAGVRSIQSVTFTSGNDVGLFALVLVKPIIHGVLLEQTAPCEILPFEHTGISPRIYDDAFLNLITLPQGSLSGVSFHGEIEVAWN